MSRKVDLQNGTTVTLSENLTYTKEIQQNVWHKYFNSYRLNDLSKFKYIGILGTLYMHYA